MKIRVFDKISEIGENHWQNITPESFPFANYQYLNALEQSHSVGVRAGWQPHYITCWSNDELLGGVVSYLKNHSYGEYIFDFAWANAYQATGMNYYPKLVTAIPFTPVTGPKILLNPKASADIAHHLLQALELSAANFQASSVHALFITSHEMKNFLEADFEVRESYQFHWRNQNYKSFDDFLLSLKSKRRKEILRERNQVAAANLKITSLTGADLNASHAKIMYQFYFDTTQKMSGHTYLTERFFTSVFEQMKDQILFVLAQDDKGRAVAGALNYFSADHLYGRYWGCLEDYKSLHFELCYYRTIEFAILRKMKLFEAGAQGEHKFQRGFLPSRTYSAHKIFDPRFREAIGDFIEREKEQIELMFKDYESHNPFKIMDSPQKFI